MKNLKKKLARLKPAPLTQQQPKPQIPTMLRALRRQGDTGRSLIDALEAKMGPVLRPAGGIIGTATEAFTDAAPLADQLAESVASYAALNARLRDITARLEL